METPEERVSGPEDKRAAFEQWKKDLDVQLENFLGQEEVLVNTVREARETVLRTLAGFSDLKEQVLNVRAKIQEADNGSEGLVVFLNQKLDQVEKEILYCKEVDAGMAGVIKELEKRFGTKEGAGDTMPG
jgi:hypothetical protein